MGKKGDFVEGKIWKHIIAQAVPLTIAQLVQVLYNIVDRIYIGHIQEANAGMALTGVGVAFPVLTLVAAFTNLFATGGAPLCSIARGRGDVKEAEDILGNTLVMQIITGIVIGIALFFTMKPILYAFGASDVTYPYAESYLRIYLCGTVFFMLGTGMNSFISLQGFPRIGMFTTLIGAVLNLIFDPIFIFWLHLGVRGAAIATVISQFASAVWVIQFLTGKKAILHLTRQNLIPDRKKIVNIMTLGLTGFIVSATNCTVQAVCNAVLGVYGGDAYIGIMTIINSVREMIGLPINGITSGSQPVLSYNYGAGEYRRVTGGIKFMGWTSGIYTFIVWMTIMLFPHFYIGIFSREEQILQFGPKALLIYFLGFVFMNFQFVGQSTFVALGKKQYSIFFSIFRKVIIVVPLVVFLPRIPALGVMGVFAAEPVSNLIGGLASFLTMYVVVYRKLNRQAEQNEKRSN